MTNCTDEDLDNYLLNQVDLRHRQVSKCVEDVQKIIKDLTTEVSSKDARFQSIANAGVHNASLKDQPALMSKWSALLRGRCAYNPAIQVLSPTLYLISVPLQGLMGYKERRTRQWRYYTLTGSRLLSPVREPEKLHQWLELESFVNPSQEWHDARMTIEGDIVPAKVVNVFKDLLETSIKTRGLTNKVSVLESVGTAVRVAVETSEAQIEVKLVPTVELMNYWPKRARWPRLFRRWPSTERARCIKTLLFWTCEKYPCTRDWKDFRGCVLRLVQKLHKCVSQHYLRHYFIRSHNLLKYSNTNELDEVAKKINHFLENPGTYIH
nr:protein mab-21-like 3 isoform X1 [Danio rerio]|eukprot:XP_021334364.1 protein mab-21-like 3 isoform X1 [Danio rerio]